MNWHPISTSVRPQPETYWLSQALDWLALTDSRSALDVSDGFGEAAAALAARGAQVLALIAESRSDDCRRRFPALKFVSGDASHFALHNGRDIVFSWMRLARMSPSDARSALSCMARALADGGELVFETAAENDEAAVSRAFAEVMAEHGFPVSGTCWRPALGEAVHQLEEDGLIITDAALFACPILLENDDAFLSRLADREEKALSKIQDRLTREAILGQTMEKCRASLRHHHAWCLDGMHLRLRALFR